MQSSVVKWGNSLGVRIPKALAEEAGLKAGSPIELKLRDGKLTIATVESPRVLLARLVEEMKNCERPEPEDDGPRGHELL